MGKDWGRLQPRPSNELYAETRSQAFWNIRPIGGRHDLDGFFKKAGCPKSDIEDGKPGRQRTPWTSKIKVFRKTPTTKNI